MPPDDPVPLAPHELPGRDIGHGMRIVWTVGRTEDRIGLIEYHDCVDGRRDGGSILFDLPEVRERFPGRAVWTVEQWEPLTLSPSIACRACPHHGWIRQGVWVPA